MKHVDKKLLFLDTMGTKKKEFLCACTSNTLPNCLMSIHNFPSRERPGRLYDVDVRGVSVGGPGEGVEGGERGTEQVQHEDDH